MFHDRFLFSFPVTNKDIVHRFYVVKKIDSGKMTQITVYDEKKHGDLAPSIVDIHIACTLEDYRTVATFVPPFDAAKREAMTRFFEDQLSRAKPGGTDDLILAFSDDHAGEEKLAGYVTLNKPVTESGPFRAHVQRLFVSPDFRRQGIARKMMMKLEEVAKVQGRTYLVGTKTRNESRIRRYELDQADEGLLETRDCVTKPGQKCLS